MGFKCGIVGLPNVGKSTLFNALTQADIESENYPFCTIEPNVGIVQLSDSRLNNLADIVNPKKIMPIKPINISIFLYICQALFFSTRFFFLNFLLTASNKIFSKSVQKLFKCFA